MDAVERQRVHFEAVSDWYYLARQNRNHLLLKSLLWRHFLSDKGYLRKPGLRVLEPMCGYSDGHQIVRDNVQAEFCYEGFDYSEVLVRRVQRAQPDLAIYRQDVTQFSPASRYDLVILIGGLHHVPTHVDAVLATLRDALVDGGYLINFEPTHANPLWAHIRDRVYQRNELFDHDTERAFVFRRLNDHYRKAGFELVDQIFPGLLTYIMYYNPDAFPFLNRFGKRLIYGLFSVEKRLYKSVFARMLSFATMSVLKKR